MNTIISLLCILVGVMVGPLAIFMFMPIGEAIQLQPVMAFGAACFLGGALSVSLVLIGAMMAHGEIEKTMYEEKKDSDTVPTTKYGDVGLGQAGLTG